MKYLTILLIFFAFLLPATVEAHTHLESSTPEEGGTVTADSPVVTLTFDSQVQEPNALTVTDEKGQEYTIETFTHAPGNVLEFEVPEGVGNGEIEFFYSIIGEDGHVMENTLTLNYTGTDTANSSEDEGATSEDSSTTQGEDTESAEDTSEETQLEQKEAAQNKESGGTSWLLPVIAVGLLLTIGFVFLGVRKKS